MGVMTRATHAQPLTLHPLNWFCTGTHIPLLLCLHPPWPVRHCIARALQHTSIRVWLWWHIQNSTTNPIICSGKSKSHSTSCLSGRHFYWRLDSLPVRHCIPRALQHNSIHVWLWWHITNSTTNPIICSPSPTARRVSRGDILIEDWTGLSRADGRSDIFQNIFGHTISFAWPGFPCWKLGYTAELAVVFACLCCSMSEYVSLHIHDVYSLKSSSWGAPASTFSRSPARCDTWRSLPSFAIWQLYFRN